MKALLFPLVAICSLALAQPSVFSDDPAALPAADLESVRPALSAVDALDGGRFGVLVVDLATGESVGMNTDAEFDIGNPDLFALPCALARVEAGEQAIDYQVSPDHTFEDILIVAGTGNDEYISKVFSIISRETISSWVEAQGCSNSQVGGVFMDWEGAPVPLPNTSTPEDCGAVLELINQQLSGSMARRVLSNPLAGTPVMEDFGDDFSAVYGVSSVDAEGSSRALVVIYPDGRRVGLVVLADRLCCEEKANLALSMMLDALATM
jgi:hypothetical protein